MVQIEIGNLYSHIEGQLSPEVQNELLAQLSYRIKDAEYTIEAINQQRMREAKRRGWNYTPTKWDGRVDLYFKDKQVFFTGMYASVVIVLKKNAVPFKVSDRRTKPEPNLDLKFTLPHGKTERDYQDLTVEACLKATRGIIQAATGAGKTLMMVKLIGKIKTGPFIFYVLTEDLLDQAYETLSLCLNQPIGRVGAGYFDIQNVTVCMVQTAVLAINRENKGFDLNTYKVEDDSGWEEAKKLVDEKGDAIANLVETAAGIYFDEVHHAACDSAKDVMMASKKAYWRFGGSATPFREDGQEKMIQALFGRKLVEISASWLIQQGWLVRPYILNVHFPDGQAGSWRSWKKIYSECIVNNDELHEFTAKLMKHLRDRGICNLALVREYKHGEALEKLVPGAPFLRGDETKTFRKQTIADLRSGKIPCAIGTTLADEGLDIERLGGIIIASGGKSITKIFQRVGRVLRTFPDKPFGIAIVIHHDGRYLRDHGKKIRRILTSEKQFIIRDVTMANVFEEIDSIIAEHQSTENLLTDETSKPTGESK
jgi:superfamily II DNA or RNA helicase